MLFFLVTNTDMNKEFAKIEDLKIMKTGRHTHSWTQEQVHPRTHADTHQPTNPNTHSHTHTHTERY